MGSIDDAASQYEYLSQFSLIEIERDFESTALGVMTLCSNRNMTHTQGMDMDLSCE